MSRRVVVTGLGLVTPLGHEVETVWSRLHRGDAGVVAPSRYAAQASPTRAVGEIANESREQLRATHADLTGKDDPRTLFGVAAGVNAIKDAGISAGHHPRAGVFLGSGPGVHRLEDFQRWLDAEGSLDAAAMGREFADVSPQSLLRNAAEQPAGQIASKYGLGGPVHAVTSACAAGNQALGMALRSVRCGECDWVVAGGADAMIDPIGLVFFVLLGASASADGDPAHACRPFDRRRSGLVMGEGAGCAVLESEAHALAREARIYAEVTGYGATLDAYRLTAPPRDGRGAAEAMQRAIDDAGLKPDQVDYVHAHGTGTKRNDPAEVRAVKSVFGEHAERLAISSSKGALGHLLAAAAGVAFALTVLAVQRDEVPPTLNLEQPDAACDLDLVPDPGRSVRVRAALNNAFAFGGQNAVIAVQKYAPRGNP